MDVILEYQWEVFIGIEVLSLVSLLLFGVVRYVFNKQKRSLSFLFLFVLLLFLEAALAIFIYRETGEFSTFQIVITIFVIYACTFGISDFKKLDRWMRLKIGNWRGTELLTEKDKYVMKKQKDPKYIAKKYRYSSMIHFLLFVIAQLIFLSYSLDSMEQAIPYLTDLSWIGTEYVEETPYSNETLYGISMVWGLVFIVDFMYSWSYTIFPSKQ
ncbi:hypothetical protein DTX80_14335 [Bacilli bacterium]|uniref:hypothetical protein n=1 Tax=Oceanobacillus caeni TaxID=405946 RepID=UPI0006213808|nr:hypothetical protein WH51_15110 [Bacilli bacterium VT-13-104]PZD84007.1 hypothetical protein DEJ64_13095 [Bacilli bacterium]PZD85332.1 hypothetical protein DEJ60_12510 [Bacilli bacterium]PZD86126.1 hypothetical protein DEJ66_15955 [Bacilli bacterium]RCO04900.1 hypothetical protein DTX80_14335 [Bacilli bacterium]